MAASRKRGAGDTTTTTTTYASALEVGSCTWCGGPPRRSVDPLKLFPSLHEIFENRNYCSWDCLYSFMAERYPFDSSVMKAARKAIRNTISREPRSIPPQQRSARVQVERPPVYYDPLCADPLYTWRIEAEARSPFFPSPHADPFFRRQLEPEEPVAM